MLIAVTEILLVKKHQKFTGRFQCKTWYLY